MAPPHLPVDLPAPAGTIVAAGRCARGAADPVSLISVPDPGITGDALDLSRKLGIFLGLIAAAGIALGGYLATNERATGRGPA